MGLVNPIKQAAAALAGRRSWPAWIYAFLFASSVVVGSKIAYDGHMGHLPENFIRPLTWTDAVIVVIATPLCALLVALLSQAVERVVDGRTLPRDEAEPGAPRLQDSKRFRVYVAAIAASFFVAWAPYILTYAPGSIVGDTLSSLAQPHQVRWSNVAPIGFTLFIKAFTRIGVALGDIDYGVFLFTLFQSTLMATLLAYAIMSLARRGAPVYWSVAAWAYFAFVPIFPIYAINMQKDTLFALALLSMSLYLLKVVDSGGELLKSRKGITTFITICLVTLFVRNNGFYIVVGVTLALALAYKGALRTFYITVTVVLVAFFLLEGPGFALLKIRNGTFVESVGVPMQQIAYVRSTGGYVSPKQQQFLDRILPAQKWTSRYVPTLVDPLKWDPQFDGQFLLHHRPQFLIVWAEIFVRNPVAYFNAYCLNTFGFWKLGANNAKGYAETIVHRNNLHIYPVDLFRRLTGTSIMPILDGTRGKDGAGGYVGAGAVAWLMLLAVTLVALRRRWDLMIVALPALLVWLTIMIATPTAFSFRYVFALPVCIPGLVLLPFAPKPRPDTQSAPLES